jgi:hypothetical protein
MDASYQITQIILPLIILFGSVTILLVAVFSKACKTEPKVKVSYLIIGLVCLVVFGVDAGRFFHLVPRILSWAVHFLAGGLCAGIFISMFIWSTPEQRKKLLSFP